MPRWIWRDGEFLEIPKDYTPPRPKAPYVISDHHDAFKSMADGLWYESKSAYRKSLRAKGLVEMGHEMPKETPYTPPSARQDIKDALEQLSTGNAAKPANEKAIKASISTGKVSI